jgi:hypothetical protein
MDWNLEPVPNLDNLKSRIRNWTKIVRIHNTGYVISYYRASHKIFVSEVAKMECFRKIKNNTSITVY